jgi:hypothetical protein
MWRWGGAGDAAGRRYQRTGLEAQTRCNACSRSAASKVRHPDCAGCLMLANLSLRYADQNERDYQEFVTAVRSGRLEALEGV